MIIKNTPPLVLDSLSWSGEVVKRSSNLELYRIVCMLMIIAHHYLVISGLTSLNGPILTNPDSANSLFLLFFGAWGKVGINCFLMITGYFMCSSKITLRKFVKLISQIYFYNIILFLVFAITGYETFTIKRIALLLFPFYGFGVNNFVSCYMAFYLTIPFLNILIHNLNQRQHEWLIILSLLLFTICGTLPKFEVPLNYITWFGIIYFIASYIKLYPRPVFMKRRLWGVLSLSILLASIISIVAITYLFGSIHSWYLLHDSNKILAVAFAVCSFLWFKNMNIKYSRIINSFGAGTFGVLLIHTNSNAMVIWLWKDAVDVVGHFSLPFCQLVLFSVGVVLAVFVVCNLIDQLRIATLEKWIFNWYDAKYAYRADALVKQIIIGKQ